VTLIVSYLLALQTIIILVTSRSTYINTPTASHAMSTSALRLTAILVLGVAVRVVLHLAGFQEIFATSYEISTPVSSHKRGMYMHSCRRQILL
jgi:uncharacterized membrane protein